MNLKETDSAVGESKLNSCGSGQGKKGGSSKYSKESLDSTECQEFPDCLKPTSFSTKTSIPSS